jgi:hypothetical protein
MFARALSVVASMFLVDSVLRKEQASNVAFNGSAFADIGLLQPAHEAAVSVELLRREKISVIVSGRFPRSRLRDNFRAQRPVTS